MEWQQFNRDFGALNWLEGSATQYAARGAIDPRCQKLLNDVLKVVFAGGFIQFGCIDRLTRSLGWMWEATKNTVTENPVQTASYVVGGTIGVVSGGAMGGGVALGVKYGGKMVTDTAKDWWKGDSKKLAAAQQNLESQAHIRITRRAAMGGLVNNEGTKKQRKDLVVNEEYGDKVLADVGTVIKLGGLKKLHEAFFALKKDFDVLKCQGFSVVNQSNENKPPTVTYNPAALKTCDDHARIWEHIFRVRKRLLDVAEAGQMLETFVTYIAMMVSKYTAEADPLVSGLWDTIVKSKPVRKKVARQIARSEAAAVMEYLGQQLKSAPFQETYGDLTKGQRDLGVWAYGVLRHIMEKKYPGDKSSPEYQATFAYQLDLEAQRRLDPSGFAKRGREAWEQLKKLSTQGIDVGKKTGEDLLDAYNPLNCDMYVNALGSIVQDALVSEEGLQIPKTLLDGAVDILSRHFDLFANFGELTFTDGMASSISVGVDPSNLNLFSGAMIVAEPLANAYLQNRTRRMVDPSNKTWSQADKVLALRELAEKSAKKYIKVIKDFKDAAELIKTQPRPASKAFEALLKYCLAQEVYYHNHTGQMLQDAAIAIARFRVLLHIFEAKALAATNDFLAGHADQPCNRTACCYGSLLKALASGSNDSSLTAKLTQREKRDYAAAPCQRVNERNELDAVFWELVKR